jgi:hypothetical protein
MTFADEAMVFISRTSKAHHWKRSTARASACGVVLAGALALGGCYASTGYVEADFTPAYVEEYPQTYYDGHTVYLIDGRWYLRDSGTWVYLRREPPVLYRYRLGLGAHRYPSRHHHVHVHRAHRAHRVAPPPRRDEAPPARHAAPPAWRR